MVEFDPILLDLLVALGIGALIGLQRERSADGRAVAAGSRTLPLIALLGGLSQAYFHGLVIAAFIGVLVLATAGYLAKLHLFSDIGLTSPVSTILTFLYGAMAVYSAETRVLAVVFGVLTTVILSLKTPLHGMARRISGEEARATLIFLVVALVILPLLPDEPLDALYGLNLRFAWLMVVFIAGIDLAAYLFVKFVGPRKGIVLTGAIGGMVSSTATTVSVANRTRRQPGLHLLFGLTAVLASAIMMGRVVLEVAVVNPSLVDNLIAPVLLIFLWLAAVSVFLLRKQDGDPGDAPELKNPFRLTPALVFGLFFALVLIATKWLNTEFGSAGVYVAALNSGLVDVDAVTLSLSRLESEGALTETVATSGILIVSASNFVFKIAIVAFLGTRRLVYVAIASLGVAAAIALAFVGAWNLG